MKYHIGRYGGHIWQNFGFIGIGYTSRAHTQYRVKASKRLGVTPLVVDADGCITLHRIPKFGVEIVGASVDGVLEELTKGCR